MVAKKMELVKAEEQAVPAAQGEGATILAMMDKAMQMPDVPVAKLEQLFELHQKVEAEHARKAFAAAFTAAQAEMEPIAKDADNKQTKSKYATHAALDRALRPIYTKHGFGVSFNTTDSPLDQHIRVLLCLSHRDGHERTYQADIPADGKGAKGGDVMTKTHAAGSAFKYGQRYLLGLAWNVATVEQDDDGNGAGSQDGGFEPISEKQLNELIKLADEVGADKARFCKFVGIESFSEILVKDFNKAREMLVAKGKKAEA